jgi:acyl carrier protein
VGVEHRVEYLESYIVCRWSQCQCGQTSLPIFVTSDIDGVGESLNDGIPSHTGDSGTQRIWLPAVPTRNVSHPPLGDMSTRNSVVTLEAVTQQIIDLVEKDLDAVDLTADSSLQSQGLDSLKVISLVFKIEEHYDIVLDGEDADDLRTVGDLANLVIRRIEQQS